MARLISRPARERSRIATALLDANQGEPYTVHLDVQLTRRKRHHMIEDCDGGIVFRSRWFSDVLDWLDAQGVVRYRLRTDRRTFAATVEPTES